MRWWHTRPILPEFGGRSWRWRNRCWQNDKETKIGRILIRGWHFTILNAFGPCSRSFSSFFKCIPSHSCTFIIDGNKYIWFISWWEDGLETLDCWQQLECWDLKANDVKLKFLDQLANVFHSTPTKWWFNPLLWGLHILSPYMFILHFDIFSHLPSSS